MDGALPSQSLPPPQATPPSATQPAEYPPQTPINGSNGHKILKRIAFIVSIFVFVVIGIGISAMAITVYTDTKLPLLSKHKKDLTLIFYKIPLIPKNPEQILITAIDKNTKLKTYTPDFSLTAQIKSTDVEIGSLDLQVDGPVDITNEKNIAFSIDGKASINFGGHSYELDGKVIKKDKAVYGKVDKLPDGLIQLYGGLSGGTAAGQQSDAEIKNNLTELYKNWIKYEFSSLPTKARAELEKNIESTSITNSIREEAQNFLLKSSILPEVKKLKDEKIEGVDTYHLLLNPNKEKTKQIILEYINDHESLQKGTNKKTAKAIAGSFEQLHLEVWIGKNDAIIRKTSVQTEMNLGFISALLNPNNTLPTTSPSNFLGIGDFGKAVLDFSTVLVLKDVNKPVTITLPPKTVTVENYMKLFQDALITKAAREERDSEQQLQSDMTELTNAMTVYFVEKGSYPATLAELNGKYISSSSITSQHLSKYSYRRGSNPTKYIIFIIKSSKYTAGSTTPFYGITDSYTYPHNLSASEFADINK